MKYTLFFCLLCSWCMATSAQDNARWLRYPRISPDGTHIAFGYKGDIYVVSSQGGKAIPLTIHEAQDMMPVWSHDGKQIAFASDRYGNFDVFVMPAEGGIPRRVTTHSAADYPQDFSPDDQQILFTSGRTGGAANIRFYSPRLFQNLYTVPVNGGTPKLLSEAGMSIARYNDDGTRIVFQDRKGYEDNWRKHHTSAVTRDIWSWDLVHNSYQKISDFAGEDLDPVYAPGSDDIYYLSECSGSLNVYRNHQGQTDAVTHFKTHPVRTLSISRNHTLCFTYQGEIYIQAEGSAAQKLAIQIQNDGRSGIEKNMPVNGGITEFALSPNGKEIAFVNRGEVFVSSVEGTQTKRITNTPAQERHVHWKPDGRTLVYASERGTSWDIYEASIQRSEEPYFYAATLIREDVLLATAEEEYQPRFSPDGKELAYVAERNALKVYNLDSKETRTLIPLGRTYSYSDGDWDYAWSPDGKYLLSDDGEGYWYNGNVALLQANGTDSIQHPLRSGYGQSNVKWALDGKAMAYLNAKNGRRSMAMQGSRETDLYLAFFDQAAYDRYNLSKEELSLLEEKEKKDKEAKDKKEKDEVAPVAKSKKEKAIDKESKDSPESVLNTAQLKNRVKRITINSCSISDYAVNNDGSKVYYLAAFEKGFDLWVTEPRTKETKILAKFGAGGGSIEMSKDGKTLFVLKDGNITKVEEGGKTEGIGIAGEMTLQPAAERRYILDHAYRQVKKKFYDPNLHGVDWDGLYTYYASFLPFIGNNYDFQDLLGEFLGELNASHTGGRYSPSFANGDETASLGLLFDQQYAGPGLQIAEVLSGGPLDLARTHIQASDILTRIDGIVLKDSTDWAFLLNRKARKNVLLSYRSPGDEEEKEVVIKPISLGDESGLMYKRWLKRMQHLTDSLSHGQVGYVHVKGMDDGSFREVFDEVLGENYNSKAIIVDTRFNGGGWLHDDLNTFLSGKQYLDFAPQSHRLPDGEPMGRWTKPSCVLMSEGNYSDAFIFPYVYKQEHIGKTIGMPVPGTGTAVWWETQIDPSMVFGIPMIATIGKENRPTENLQVEPDIRVPLLYDDFMNGRDTQLEAAVAEMLREIKP